MLKKEESKQEDSGNISEEDLDEVDDSIGNILEMGDEDEDALLAKIDEDDDPESNVGA